ncbi:MAG: ADP-ribosylglycohydrolase family protein [Spirochaetes bacterium]|nr:MAG: ADP-ribosylglycohydrolase family protein [Spirochaetota bacterium]RKX98789.1 MAG: ADP-ribosylglycohydrolase family protein [Spirochaetota bacterium]
MDYNRYLEQLYGGLLGKCAGVRLGAPVEPTIWTYERIRDTYGEITGYVKEYKNFAADDDVNGPLFFIRALLDYKGKVTEKEIGYTWLNYTREGIGFYWWGGYGRSTEHTAYLNLKAGMDAPASGSAEVNGLSVAEQIGGQIFIDSWGWAFPDNPEKAAQFARMAASVSHDRNGIYGGIFIAVCISLAFAKQDISGIINEALTWIPEDSEYTRVVEGVRDFHQNNPGDWRLCRDFLESDFGYNRYPGVCHMIPNAGICALALYYGQGDFARSIEIATMCGWDTDCNAGNVGAILGVMNGPEGIPLRYRRPINDFHAASSISGALNIIDLPTAAREMAILGMEQRDEPVPERWRKGAFSDDLFFDFSLPGASSGLRTSSDYLAPIGAGEDFYRKDSVSILLDRLVRGDTARIFYKPYYRQDDFDDQRYSPTFTPLVYPGQILRIKVETEKMNGQRIAVAPYVRDSESKEIINGAYIFPESGENTEISWTIPQLPFAVDEAGLLVTNFDSEKYLGHLYIKEFEISGKKEFFIDFKLERKEFGGLSRCSCIGGAWELEQQSLHVLTQESFFLFTGPYYLKDCHVEVLLIPEIGESHLLIVRSGGMETGYFFGLSGNNKVRLFKKDHETVLLAESDYPWKIGTEYLLSVDAVGGQLSCSINNGEVLSFTDKKPLISGMAGLAKLDGGRTRFLSLSCREM